ncbi:MULTISPECIES: MOSC domain-containing protein [unclassified Rhodococcus (in: high G+C Gram-positive bacteria)]|uniref:MOSC domain-containing protein n=1 Tax=unclassified Rhodococcus (in: high G+C Gram-positive bacteria) TaxID=192944 RepID=UPI00163A38FF|nr:MULTISPECIES: MOSC domain-containing protein [unclassified Rhodococcus (in: high G+C Gram-positive bacteria)]MBC2642570.1 MOSC domain-containing protein [Rhodococcus sp. 3A]MBC2892688.1 MOSC domain-containing protein [Rhodococcus sp. 4CII]
MATLSSLNVGMPRDVSWRGRTVHTGVWKWPVDGPRTVRRLNIDGDGQGDLGGHGGENRAVLVYQTESYRHWSEHLRRSDLAPGHFGENFTVDGLPDDEVCIGDRYRIGTAVFEVTQPRVTCYRVGMRMNEPQMAALLVSHRRPGFYLRVIEEGQVEAGQDVVKIASGPEAVTVADIDALLYLPGHPRDALERALRIPALSPGWRGSLQSLLDQADTGTGGNTGLSRTAGSPPPAWPGFRPLTVTGRHPESRDVLSFTLAATDGTDLPSWCAGQSVTLRVHPADGTALVRSYSLSNRPGAAEYRISVKREPHGAAGRFLHSRVHEGDTLEVSAPRGTFFLDGGTSPVVLVSAGVGVTPVLSMLYALAEQDSARPVWWVHGARNGSEHAFADETRDLLGRLPGSGAHIAYSRPDDTDRRGVDYATAGRLSAELIGGLGLPHDAEAYLCGPASFMADLGSALAEHGLDPARIHVETFGAEGSLNPGVVPSDSAAPVPHPPPGRPGSGPVVSFARSGLTVPWDPGRGTLLEFAEACDVPTRWSCRTGVCHSCETVLLSGSVDYDPEPVERPAEGNTLLCCSRPADAVVLDL